jgi:hypothetical protein
MLSATRAAARSRLAGSSIRRRVAEDGSDLATIEVGEQVVGRGHELIVDPTMRRTVRAVSDVPGVTASTSACPMFSGRGTHNAHD